MPRYMYPLYHQIHHCVNGLWWKRSLKYWLIYKILWTDVLETLIECYMELFAPMGYMVCGYLNLLGPSTGIRSISRSATKMEVFFNLKFQHSVLTSLISSWDVIENVIQNWANWFILYFFVYVCMLQGHMIRMTKSLTKTV